MIKAHWFFAVCCIFALLITGVSAAVYSTDNAVTVSLKYNNGEPTVSETFMRVVTGKTMAGEMLELAPPPDPEKELVNRLTITTATDTYTKTIQTAPVSTVYVTSTTREDTDVMQVSTDPKFPALEIYWGYDKAEKIAWEHYMRIDKVGDTVAVYGDFRTKQIWLKPITTARMNEIINSGTIPGWGAV